MDFLKSVQNVKQPVWLAVMVVGFVWFWPVGLAALAAMAWTGKIGNRGGAPWTSGFWSSGNTAYDKHYEEARKALNDERTAFGEFMEAKMTEKDRADFADFMNKRSPPANPFKQ